MANKCTSYTDFFKALADIKRMSILKDLNLCNCNKCGQDILEINNISQPTLSHHIKLLTDNKILKPIRDKNKITYKVNTDFIEEKMKQFINELKNFSECKTCSTNLKKESEIESSLDCTLNSDITSKCNIGIENDNNCIKEIANVQCNLELDQKDKTKLNLNDKAL